MREGVGLIQKHRPDCKSRTHGGGEALNSGRKLKMRLPHPTHTPRKWQLMLEVTPVERRVENILPWGEFTPLLEALPPLSRSGCLGLSLLPSRLLDTQIPLFMPNLKTDKGPPK